MYTVVEERWKNTQRWRSSVSEQVRLGAAAHGNAALLLGVGQQIGDDGVDRLGQRQDLQHPGDAADGRP